MLSFKEKLERFDLTKFGEATADLFSLVEREYAAPVYTPTHAHPRICLTAEKLPAIRAALENPAYKVAADQFRAYVEAPCDGILGAAEEKFLNRGGVHNFDHRILAQIEAKALNYLLTGEAEFGYEALLAMLNFLDTLDIQWISSDGCREHGYAMFIAAEVYDWCYDLMTPAVRQAMIAAVENRLCAGEVGYPEFTPTKLYRRKMEVGFPPAVQDNGVNGHGSEAQLLRDYPAFAMAIYDENPTWWRLVGAILEESYIPVRRIYYAAEYYPQGTSCYFCHRFYSDLYSAWLYMHAMGENPYTGIERVASSVFTAEMPNAETLYGSGDGGNMPPLRNYKNIATITAAISGDPVMWGAAKSVGALDVIGTGTTTITASALLIFVAGGTDSVEDYRAHLPLSRYHGDYMGLLTSRARWHDKNAPSVQMKVGVRSTANHEHGDGGSFQIYYKGLLSCDGGVYSNYGHYQTSMYHASSVAHNTLLIADPSRLDQTSDDPKVKWYSGSQRIRMSVADWANNPGCEVGEVTGMRCGYKNEAQTEAEYAYLAGDLTKAYDEAEYVGRRMLTVYTDNPDYPMAMFIYDDITACGADFEKKFLLQIPVAEAPVIGGNTVITERDGGRLILTSLTDEAKITGVGGEGKRQLIGELECLTADGRSDGHWGRVEISLPTGERDGAFLNVLTVTDAGSSAPMPETSQLSGTGIRGAIFGDIAAVFASSRERETAPVTFRLPRGARCCISGLADGAWKVFAGGSETTVTAEGGLAVVAADAGEVRVQRA